MRTLISPNKCALSHVIHKSPLLRLVDLGHYNQTIYQLANKLVLIPATRWREVLTSSAPGSLAQLQTLVVRMPEVAEVSAC